MNKPSLAAIMETKLHQSNQRNPPNKQRYFNGSRAWVRGLRKFGHRTATSGGRNTSGKIIDPGMRFAEALKAVIAVKI